MPNRLTDIRVKRVSFVNRGAVRDPRDPSEPRRRLLWKSEDAIEPAAEPPDPKGTTMSDMDELRAAVEKAERERDEALRKAQDVEDALEKASKKKANADDDTDDEKEPQRNEDGTVVKSELPEPVRAALEKAEQKEAEAIRKAEEAEKIAKEERDLRLTREFIAKAESEFPHGSDPAELGPRLMKMEAALSKEDYDAHLTELRSLNEQVATSNLFKEAGVGGRPAHGKSDEVATTVAKAEELRKADPSLSEAEAFRRAAKDPEVQKAYLAERG